MSGARRRLRKSADEAEIVGVQSVKSVLIRADTQVESCLPSEITFLPPTMGAPFQQEIGGQVPIPPRSDGRRYEAVLQLSEALSACGEPEELTKILSRELGEFLDFFEFYIILYKENSTELEWAVLDPEKTQVATYRGVPVQDRRSWRVYTTQEPYYILDWNTDEAVSAGLKQGLAGQGIEVGPVVFVPLTTPHRRLGALGVSGTPGTVYGVDDISFLRLVGRVVAFAIDDNFNLRHAEAAQAEVQFQNARLQQSERELRELIENDPGDGMDGGPRRCSYICEWALVGLHRPFSGSDFGVRLEVCRSFRRPGAARQEVASIRCQWGAVRA